MCLKELIRIAIFLLITFSLEASHGAGAYLNARTFNNGMNIELELHVFQLNDGSVAQFPSAFQVSALSSFNLYIVDTLIHSLGDSLCPAGSLREYIYRGSAGVWLDANDAVFEVVTPCCFVDSVINLNDNSNPIMRTSISIPTVHFGGPGSNNYRMVSVNTLNMKVSLQQSANTDHNTVLDYSVHSMPIGIDSLRYHLSPVGGQGSGSVYKPGYTWLNPLPDPTEDSLNAQNIFDSKGGTLSFRARGQSSDTGFYAINMDFDMYTNSAKMIRMTGLGMLYLQRGDSTLNPSLDLRAQEGSNVLALQNGDTISRSIFYGDSLTIDFKAFSSLGFKLLDGGSRGIPDTTGFYQRFQAQFQQPVINNLGSSGAQDTIYKNLFWKPGFNDFDYRSGTYHFGFYYRLDTCGSLAQKVVVEVELIPEPFINKIQDTIYACFAQNQSISASLWEDSLFWTLDTEVLESDTTLSTIDFSARKSGYVYLSHPRLGNVDSIYLKLDNMPNRIPLQLSADGMEMEFTENDSSLYQKWWLNNVIPFPGVVEDENPIIGAGSYNVWSYVHADSCPNLTDTLTIPHNERWGGNSWAGHPESQASQIALNDANYRKYTQKFRLSKGSRQLEHVYITGFRNVNGNPQNYPAPIVVELQFASGLFFSRTFNIREEGYIDYPIYYPLDSTREIDISFTIPRGIELYLIKGTGAGFEYNGLHFSDFRKITGTDTVATNLRAAIGFKFESDLSLKEPNFKPAALYPNPASDRIVISGSIGSPWLIYSVNGRFMANGRLKDESAEIFIKHFAPGLYILTVQGQNLKFVKE